MRFQALLWGVWHGRPTPTLLSARRLAKPIEIDPSLLTSFYAAIGLRVLAGLAIRPDRLERLAAAVRRLARGGPFVPAPELATIAGVEPVALRGLLAALGYRAVVTGGAETFMPSARRRRAMDKAHRRRAPAEEGHPFAKLRELKLA
jgi:ATP-dependent RNA helicase SUPV3L1/SUV3